MTKQILGLPLQQDPEPPRVLWQPRSANPPAEASRPNCGLGFSSCSGFWLEARVAAILLMIEILHYLKDPKLWELWYIRYYG